MFDFVQPRVADRRLSGFGRQAGRDEAGREGHGRLLGAAGEVSNEG